MTSSVMRPLAISASTLTTALGRGNAAQWQALRAERSGLAPRRFAGAQHLSTWTGEVSGVDTVVLPAHLRHFDCRNIRLAELALAADEFSVAVEALKTRYDLTRIGVYLGTSTSGLEQTERAYRDRAANGALPDWYVYAGTQNTFSLGAFARARFGLRGPAHVVSTACSSSAKVFASALRAMQAGLIDAALVGGVDSLCLTTLYGFNALQLLSDDVCRPADAQRNGLSIGEGAGFALVEWADVANDRAQVLVTGIGESSDAHHMSAPDPSGAGASAAMRQALARSGTLATAHGAGSSALRRIDYVNLHGTATPANDLVEDLAVCAVLGTAVPCSSTKGWTGHTLGAAGIVETLLTARCLRENWLPKSLHTRAVDTRLRGNVLLASREQKIQRALTNSFGFGGSNCSIVLERA